MQLDFNSLRFSAQLNLNKIINFLNEKVNKGDEYDSLFLDSNELEGLSTTLNHLRNDISTLMVAYTDTPEHIDDISEKADLTAIEF